MIRVSVTVAETIPRHGGHIPDLGDEPGLKSLASLLGPRGDGFVALRPAQLPARTSLRRDDFDPSGASREGAQSHSPAPKAGRVNADFPPDALPGRPDAVVRGAVVCGADDASMTRPVGPESQDR